LALAVAGSAVLLAPGIHALLIVLVTALLIVLVTDGYLALLLWCCACMSAEVPQQPWPGLPERRPAILVLLFALVALVTGFGSLYLLTRPLASPLQAAFVSFMNIAGFAYSYERDYGWLDKAVQAAQLSSGILLLLCALPILVSRFADIYRKPTSPVIGHREETDLVKKVADVILAPGSPSARPTITALNPSGPLSGGTRVIISGAGFNGVTAVLFGTTGAVYTIKSDTLIEATSPEVKQSGAVPVIVEVQGGKAAGGEFVYS